VAHLIDYYPLLQRLPSFLFPTHGKAQKMHEEEKSLYVSTWLEAKKSIESGTARPCFCVDMARHQQTDGFSDSLAAYISGSLLEAGSDTTSNTLYGFVQAMVLFPAVQKRAQAELDRVVGAARLPTMDDEPHLQYIRGCVKESLRWMPTAIIGSIPHALTRDDEYMGYRIPAGAAVMNNVYTVHMDPDRYPAPRSFDPDRYRDDLQSAYDSAASPDVAHRDHFTFGAGRRICQGMHVAERSLFLGISRLLWGFDIEAKVDERTGQKIMPDPERYTQGFVCMPEPFEAGIRVRSEARERVMRREWEVARESLDDVSGQWKRVPEGMKLPGL
jgi:cytochrome P450